MRRQVQVCRNTFVPVCRIKLHLFRTPIGMCLFDLDYAGIEGSLVVVVDPSVDRKGCIAHRLLFAVISPFRFNRTRELCRRLSRRSVQAERRP